MSIIRGYRIPAGVPRNYSQVVEASSNVSVPTYERDSAIGLDWMVFNRGASSLTVTVDGNDITIPGGGNRGWDNIAFELIQVTSSVAYTLQVAGVEIESLAD